MGKKKTIYCALCGNAINLGPFSNRVIYCSVCKPVQRTEYLRKYHRNRYLMTKYTSYSLTSYIGKLLKEQKNMIEDNKRK